MGNIVNTTGNGNSVALLENIAKYNIYSNGTTNDRCLGGHTWTYSGAINMNLEGVPCDCGQVIYHLEKCPCCGQIYSKHILK